MNSGFNYARYRASILTNNLTEDDLPINPLKLIQDLYKVDLFYEDLCGEEGYTFFNPANNKYRIFIDNNYRVSRRNFTIAHEVGHIVLGHFLNFDLSNPEIHKMLDKHANAFASALLMPTHILKKFDCLSANYIANAFNVSIEALSIRTNYVKINIV